jgi:hypothetical protein
VGQSVLNGGLSGTNKRRRHREQSTMRGGISGNDIKTTGVHGGVSGMNNNQIDHSEVSPVGLKQQKCTEESPAPIKTTMDRTEESPATTSRSKRLVSTSAPVTREAGW